MATKSFNRVHVVTATTGTGTLTLGAAAAANVLTFAQAGAVDGDEVNYVLEDGADFEIGTGVLGDDVSTLTRATVHLSKAGAMIGTDKIELSGNGRVRSVEPAELFNENILRAGKSSIGDLIDVDIETIAPGTGDALVFNGAKFAPGEVSGGGVLRGQIFGLTLSNNATDAAHDLDIASGEAASDAASPDLITLSAGLTKRLDAAWAVGDGNGGLDTGTVADGTYHVFLIQRSDTNIVDVLFSASVDAPTMPTNYDRKRRIGSLVYNSGIVPFVQSGDTFQLKTPVQIVSSNNPGTAAVVQSAPVPTGVELDLSLVGHLLNNSATANTNSAVVTSLAQNDIEPHAGLIGQMMFSSTARALSCAAFSVRTNTSGQFRWRIELSNADQYLRLALFAWIDTRGRI